jgi:DNA-directed RNA polymerase specialized sigma24 family protein
MSRQKKETRYEVLRQDPEYIKDWQEWQDIEDEVQWEVKKRALQEKFGVEELPNPLYDPQKRDKEKIWPAQRSSKKHIPLEDYVRVQMEGARDDDPEELKQYSAWYEAKQHERKKWAIVITSEDLSTLDSLASDALAKGKGEKDEKKLARFWEGYENKLAGIIETWARKHPELAPEPFQSKTGKKRWLAMMGFVREKDFKRPILPKYPFETYFLTVNIFAKLYGLSPQVADAILFRISEVYQHAKKGERLSGEAAEPSERKSPRGRKTEWQTQSERMEAKAVEGAEQDGVNRKALSHTEILSEQYAKYVEVIGTISRQVAKKILNLEAYLHDCFKNAYKRGGPAGKRPPSRMSVISAEEKSLIEDVSGFAEQTLKNYNSVGLHGSIPSPAKILDSRDAQKRMAEWRKKFRNAAPFSQTQKDILMMRQTGFNLKEIADEKGVDVSTVKRELKALRSDPGYQELYRQYEEISEDVGDVAPYRRPQIRENNPRICPACGVGFGKGTTHEECPFCHAELPRVPIK